MSEQCVIHHAYTGFQENRPPVEASPLEKESRQKEKASYQAIQALSNQEPWAQHSL